MIPGLGADERLFYPQQAFFRNSITPHWRLPKNGETLEQYAERWAKDLRLQPGCALAGVSFGGMVALEMSRWVKTEAVFLIGSCRDPHSIPWGLRKAGLLPTWPWMSKGFTKAFPSTGAWLLGAKAVGERELLIRMFLETPDFFLRWTVRAIQGWGGYPGEHPWVHHIHGERDRLIPVRNVKPDQVIPGGGHLISLSHAGEVNRFIAGRWRNGANKKGRSPQGAALK